MAGAEKRNITKSKIVNYIINHEATSKVELSKDLNLSMPTVLSNVNELLANGIAVETGEYESTGGRKAKRISINPAYRYAVGIRITAKHAGFVLVNLSYEIEKYERIRLEFSTEAAYYLQLSEALERFLSDVEHRERILGIGISIPGIVNSKERMLIKSHGSGCCRRRYGRDDDASCGAALRRFGDVRCGHQPDDRPKHTCGRSPLHVGLRRGAAATHRNGDDPLDPSDGARRCAACRTNAVRMDGRRRVDDTFRRCRTSVDPARLRCRGRSALRRRSRRLLSGRSAGQLPGLAFHDHRYGGRADGARDVAGGGRACGQPYQDLQFDRLCGYRTGARGARCLGDGQLLRRGAACLPTR